MRFPSTWRIPKIRNLDWSFQPHHKTASRQLRTSTNMAGVSAILYASITSPTTLIAEPEDAKELKHHLKGRVGFTNPWDSFRDWSVPWILRTMLWRRISGKQNVPDTTPPTVPVHKPKLLSTRETSALRATWLGHACYYVEFPGGFRVLFDPVFTPRCSPFSFMGPKRYTDVPCQIEELPFVDAVVISHNHYDHLSYPTIMKIQQKYPNVHFFAPLGNKKWFSKCGIENMTELDWWQQRDITLESQPSANGTTNDKKVEPTDSSTEPLQPSDPFTSISATISCLPCQHLSARGPFDKCHTLWASWSVVSGGKAVYFGGDTAYRTVPATVPEEACDEWTPEIHGKYPHCPAFKQIGDYRGPFDLGLIPIGAYKPRFVMSAMHANPFDAVNIFKDTKCKRAMGIHWGTWVLTEEDVLQPREILKLALKCNSLPETGTFDVCDIGESREFA